MYQMCLSSQSSVLNVVLNKTALLLALKPLPSIYVQYDRNQSSIDNHQGPFLIQFHYLIVGYCIFIYFITYLNTFIDSVLKLCWITQVMYIVELLNFYQSYNDKSMYRLLIAQANNGFMNKVKA